MCSYDTHQLKLLEVALCVQSGLTTDTVQIDLTLAH